MAKLKIVMEVEFSDLPDEVRDELADGLNFRADEDNEIADDLDPVPSLEDTCAEDLVAATHEFFDGLSDYEMQAELWAGSSFYGYISQFKIIGVEAI